MSTSPYIFIYRVPGSYHRKKCKKFAVETPVLKIKSRPTSGITAGDINGYFVHAVVEKQNQIANVLMEEYERQSVYKLTWVSKKISNSSSIPYHKLSHYASANTSKHFIDGNNTVSEIRKDYVARCREKISSTMTFYHFWTLFTSDFRTAKVGPTRLVTIRDSDLSLLHKKITD